MIEEGVKAVTSIASSQYVWSILFICLLTGVLWTVKVRIEKMEESNQVIVDKLDTSHNQRLDLLMDVWRETKEDSQNREKELFDHNQSLVEQMERHNNSLEEINKTQIKMQGNLTSLQHGLNRMNDNIAKLEYRIERVEQNQEGR